MKRIKKPGKLSTAILGATARYGFALAVTILSATAANATPTWPMAPYSYFANSEPLEEVLRKFASGFSLGLRMAPGVNGLVNGKFTAASPSDFMDKLSGVYGFTWFVYAGTLYVSPASAMVTKTVSVGSGSISGVRQALDRLGVLDPRFGWGEVPTQGLALVSGPPQYVDLVERTIKSLPRSDGRQAVAVFRLKYASVNDRVVRYRDQTVKTPGLATVLRQLVSGGSMTGSAAMGGIVGAAPGNASGNYAGAGINGSPAPLDDGSGNAGNLLAGGMRTQQAIVEADARLNAIIVQDIPERIPIYRALIEQLDVPSTLIEIEAMIVNVSADALDKLGVKWGATVGKTSVSYGGVPQQFDDGLEPGSIGIGVTGVLRAQLTALEKRNEANVLSRPSVLTADNMGAVLDTSKSYYISLKGERVAAVKQVQAGTSLRVTPRYISSPSGPKVEMAIDIDDGAILDESPKVDNYPMTTETTISTLATVADGDTLLIGGLRVTTDQDKKVKVPLLGDIPLIGSLFSYKERASNKQWRLFLIRPRVVQVNGEPVLATSLSRWGDVVNETWEAASPASALELMGPALRLASEGNTKVNHSVATMSLPPLPAAGGQ